MRRRGFLLAVVLVLSVVLLVMGMGYLGSVSTQYASTYQSLAAAQARALCMAGLEDARIKLEKDPEFPPTGSQGQSFSYTEEVTDLSGKLLGNYQIFIDSTYRNAPFKVLLIRCQGQCGPRTKPTAQNTIRATLQLSKANPATYFRYLRWEDGGSY